MANHFSPSSNSFVYKKVANSPSVPKRNPISQPSQALEIDFNEFLKAARAYEANLLARINLSAKEQDLNKHSLAVSNAKSQDLFKKIFIIDQKLCKIDQEIQILQSEHENAEKTFALKQKEISDLSESIKRHNSAKEAIERSKKTSVETTEEISNLQQDIKVLKEVAVDEEKEFAIKEAMAVKAFEERLRVKRIESKLAICIENAKFRSVSNISRCEGLLQCDQLAADLDLQKKKCEKVQKKVVNRSKGKYSELVEHEADEDVLSSTKLIKFVLFFFIGYLITEIFGGLISN